MSAFKVYQELKALKTDGESLSQNLAVKSLINYVLNLLDIVPEPKSKASLLTNIGPTSVVQYWHAHLPFSHRFTFLLTITFARKNYVTDLKVNIIMSRMCVSVYVRKNDVIMCVVYFTVNVKFHYYP